MPNGLTDTIAFPEEEQVTFVEDGGQDAPIAALIAIRDEVGEEALTDEEYALLSDYELQMRPVASAQDHQANLAEYVDERDLSKIALDVLNWVEWDEESRAEWQTIEQSGIRALGVSPNVDGGANFEGASTVVHPLLGEACVQFASRALDVLWPAEGPVKSKILGTITEDRQTQAKRVEQFLNYQYTELMPGAFEQIDKLLIRLPLSGSCFIKAYYDPINGVMRSLVEPADFIVPYRATDLLTTPRYTERVLMSQNDVRRRQVAGLYRDVELIAPTEDSHEQKRALVIQEISDTEGRSEQQFVTDDHRRTLFECYCELDLNGFEDEKDGKKTGIALPYVVTVDKDSRKVLSIYRNWKESDPQKKRIVYHVHYRFMPGLGFYGYGLYHWIGGMSAAATGALRALLDSASFANQQGGYKVGDVAIKDPDKPIAPGEFREAATDLDDIRKALIPFNWKEPSVVLFNLLGHLEQLGQRFAGTTEAMIGGGTENTPVGTILARIEQGTKVFTTIQKRLHQAAGQEYKLIAWLDSVYLPEEYPYAVEGEDRGVMRSDFDSRIDVVPVSDPNVASNIQRYFISQAVMQLAAEAPDLYDRRKLHKRALASLRVDDADDLLPDRKGKRRDPVSEGAAVMVGLPLKAFIDEHHPAHIAVHQAQMAGMPKGPQAAAMMAHIQEHMAMQYLMEMQRATGIRFEMPSDDEDEREELPPEVEAQIAMRAAQAAQQMIEEQQQQPDPQAMAVMAEQQRKTAIAEQEQARKDAQTKADIERKDAVALADVTRQDRTEAQVLQERIAQHEAELMGEGL
jgi:hypothetical protein